MRQLSVAVLLAAVACTAPGGGEAPSTNPSHNIATVHEFEVVAEKGRMGFVAPTGVIGIASPVGITVTQPVTIVAVAPWEVAAGVEVLAARAVFHGRGTSPGGYRMTPALPFVTCMRSGPIRGYGASYPAEDLKLVPGDAAVFALYLRSGTKGTSATRGYRIEYRTAAGETRVVTGDTPTFEMDLRDPAELEGAEGRCNPEAGAGWGNPATGFPS